MTHTRSGQAAGKGAPTFSRRVLSAWPPRLRDPLTSELFSNVGTWVQTARCGHQECSPLQQLVGRSTWSLRPVMFLVPFTEPLRTGTTVAAAHLERIS